MDTSKITETLNASLGTLTLGSALSALLILVICLIAIRVVMGIVKRLVNKSHMDERVKGYVCKGVKLLLYVVAVIIVADSLGIPVTSLIALVSVFGLAISLAVQDVLANVASGLVILFSKPFTIGDYVDTGDGEGEVSEISLTHTKLDTPDGLRVMLPNSKMVAGKIVNYTARGVRRICHTVSAAYSVNVKDVRRAMLMAVERTDNVLADPAADVVVASYGESSIRYTVRFWVKAEHYWDAHNFCLEEIRRCFDEVGVEMTYDHLNVHIVEKK